MYPFCAHQHHDGLASGFQRSDALLQLWCALPQTSRRVFWRRDAGSAGTARLSGAAGTAAASDKGLRQDGNPLPRRGRAETAKLALCVA
ncbi:hypothetical protein H9S86_25120 [Leclercia adecarboxylata]|uniref:hypothetical protein n=1 Tax=Leclercia adecarboxylata TaxID=83655 RepID=UPI001861C740|nr:hypothetical protein [Leclercia adecarboxylata]QNP33719.1 hypothetical protein H9S86_25120 [Leclercia adecarboxylata]